MGRVGEATPIRRHHPDPLAPPSHAEGFSYHDKTRCEDGGYTWWEGRGFAPAKFYTNETCTQFCENPMGPPTETCTDSIKFCDANCPQCKTERWEFEKNGGGACVLTTTTERDACEQLDIADGYEWHWEGMVCYKKDVKSESECTALNTVAANTGFSNTCEGGRQPILDEATCRAAAAALGITFRSAVSSSQTRGGCFKKDGSCSDCGLYFNSHAGSANGVHHKVCHDRTHEFYTCLGREEESCEAFCWLSAYTTQSDCESATYPDERWWKWEKQMCYTHRANRYCGIDALSTRHSIPSLLPSSRHLPPLPSLPALAVLSALLLSTLCSRFHLARAPTLTLPSVPRRRRAPISSVASMPRRRGKNATRRMMTAGATAAMLSGTTLIPARISAQALPVDATSRAPSTNRSGSKDHRPRTRRPPTSGQTFCAASGASGSDARPRRPARRRASATTGA